MASNCCLCTFRLRHLWFGIAVEKVQEVSWTPILTPVPLALPSVAGLVNLRGQIVTAFDLCSRLDFPQTAAALWPAMVVVRSESVQLALLVDEIGEVVEPPEDAFEAARRTCGASAGSCCPECASSPGVCCRCWILTEFCKGTSRPSPEALKEMPHCADGTCRSEISASL